MIPMAAERVRLADAMIIVGTSLQVYPAASLIDFLPSQAPVYYIDPAPALGHAVNRNKNLKVVAQTATEGIPTVLHHIRKTASM
jgi:NAD-dependent deacetylase